jgi:hypothetical protein
MGVATITGLAGGSYVKAVAQTTGPSGTADPGCAAPSTYVIQLPATGPANIALPFGSWVLTSGNSASQTTPVGAAAIMTQTPNSVNAVSGTTVLTLDPRQVAP